MDSAGQVVTRKCQSCLVYQDISLFQKWFDKRSQKWQVRRKCRPCILKVEQERNKRPETRLARKESQARYLSKEDNRDKNQSRSKRWRESKAGKDNYYLSCYNITYDKYLELLDEQGGCCKICSRFSENSLAVDHDHNCCPDRSKSCGKCVRGLLCRDCNTTLGLMKDNKEWLLKMVDYLN